MPETQREASESCEAPAETATTLPSKSSSSLEWPDWRHRGSLAPGPCLDGTGPWSGILVAGARRAVVLLCVLRCRLGWAGLGWI